MDVVEIEKDQKDAPRRVLHVFLHERPGGPIELVSIEAADFDHVVESGERIVFLDSDGKEIEDIFCRADSVALIVPDNRIAKSHVFTRLEKKMADLAERLDRLERVQHPPQSPSPGE